MSNHVVQAETLSRFYGLILGLNNVSFNIGPGITGIVGPNGAGKTTLFRLLTGQIEPSSGTIRVFGQNPWNNRAVKARLAYCPENETVPPGLRPVEWLTALGMLSGFSSRDAKERARTMLARVKLLPQHWKKPLTKLSKGMKQRVKLAQCLLHNPELIILDEPMNGLDPMGREEFSNVLREIARDGRSVIISSHIIHDLEALCSQFLLLRWGRIPRASNDAASADARRRWPASTTVTCADPERLARFFFERGLVRGCEIVPDDDAVTVKWTDPEKFYGNFHTLLLESGVTIHEVRNSASFLEKAIQPAMAT